MKKMNEVKTYKVGTLYEETKTQRLVNIYNEKCTVNGIFPTITNGYFTTIVIIYFGLLLWMRFLVTVSPYITKDNVIMIMIPAFLFSLFILLIIYMMFLESFKRYSYINQLEKKGLVDCLKIFSQIKNIPTSELRKKFLEKKEEEFFNSYLNDCDIKELIQKVNENEIEVSNMNYNSLLAFLIAILTYIKIDTTLKLTYDLFEDFKSISYYLLVVLLPCVLIYSLIFYSPVIISKSLKCSVSYNKKVHYFNLLNFLERRLKKMTTVESRSEAI